MPDETPKEGLSWSKFFSGIGNPRNFAKIASHGLNILLVVLLVAGGLFIWGKLAPKKPTPITQTQTGQLTIESGANVESVYLNTQKATEAPKKTVGLEATVSSVDAGIGFVKYINDNWAVVVGGRWSYDTDDDENAVVPEIKVRYDFY